MKLPTLAGAAAAALLTVALGAPLANAADTRSASPATPAAASDCWMSHYYDGYWHHHSKLLCDHDYSYGTDNDDYYYRAHPHFNGGDNRGHERAGVTHTGDATTGRTDRGTGNADRGTTDRGTTDRGTTDRGTTDRGSGNTDRGSGNNTGNTPNGSTAGSGDTGGRDTGGSGSGGGVHR